MYLMLTLLVNITVLALKFYSRFNNIVFYRMRDIGRELCPDYVKQFTECTQKHGFAMVMSCRDERNELCECIKGWIDNQEFKDLVIEEYLNERSHFRQTGIKTKRYAR